MQISYSELINRFHEMLGTPKDMIEDTFNKPDATDVVRNTYVSMKKHDESYVIIVFEMDDKIVRIMNAYRIYPKLLDGVDISRKKPIEVLEEFMNRYGMTKTVPGHGEHKFLVKKEHNILFLGVLDIEKYLESVKKI